MRKTGFLQMQKQRRTADQRLRFRYIDSTISHITKSEISNIKPSSVVVHVQAGLCSTSSETMCVVQFRPCCQVWRLGPLDLTH